MSQLPAGACRVIADQTLPFSPHALEQFNQLRTLAGRCQQDGGSGILPIRGAIMQPFSRVDRKRRTAVALEHYGPADR